MAATAPVTSTFLSTVASTPVPASVTSSLLSTVATTRAPSLAAAASGNHSGNHTTAAPSLAITLLSTALSTAAPLATTANASNPAGVQETEHIAKALGVNLTDSEAEEVAVAAGVSGISIFLIVIMCVVAFFVLKRWGAQWIGRAIEHGIENFDEHYLGVNVNIKDNGLVVDAAHGRIELDGLVVENPKGYYNEYFAKIGKVVLDLDMAAIVCSRGKKIVIDEVILTGCDIIYETSFTTSNLQEIVDHLQGEHPAQQPGGAATAAQRPAPVEPIYPEPSKSSFPFGWCDRCSRCNSRQAPPESNIKVYMVRDASSVESSAASYKPLNQPGTTELTDSGSNPAEGQKPKPQESDQIEVEVRHLRLEDISVKAAVKQLHGSGQYVSVDKVEFDNLSEEQKQLGSSAGIAKIVSIVLHSIKHSVITNVMGKAYADEQS